MQRGFCRDVFLIFYWNIWIKFPQNIDLIVEIMPLKKPLEQSDTLHLYTVHGVFFLLFIFFNYFLFKQDFIVSVMVCSLWTEEGLSTLRLLGTILLSIKKQFLTFYIGCPKILQQLYPIMCPRIKQLFSV